MAGLLLYTVVTIIMVWRRAIVYWNNVEEKYERISIHD